MTIWWDRQSGASRNLDAMIGTMGSEMNIHNQTTDRWDRTMNRCASYSSHKFSWVTSLYLYIESHVNKKSTCSRFISWIQNDPQRPRTGWSCIAECPSPDYVHMRLTLRSKTPVALNRINYTRGQLPQRSKRDHLKIPTMSFESAVAYVRLYENKKSQSNNRNMCFEKMSPLWGTILKSLTVGEQNAICTGDFDEILSRSLTICPLSPLCFCP